MSTAPSFSNHSVIILRDGVHASGKILETLYVNIEAVMVTRHVTHQELRHVLLKKTWNINSKA